MSFVDDVVKQRVNKNALNMNSTHIPNRGDIIRLLTILYWH